MAACVYAMRDLVTHCSGTETGHVSINGVKERGNELKTQLHGRGSELRERAAEVAHQAAGQAPTGRWAKLAGFGLALFRPRSNHAEQAGAPRGVAFELLTLIGGVAGGALAGAVFNRIWRAVSSNEQVPEPTALDRNIREVLIAAVLQGAVFGLVKAAISRVTAQGYQRFAEKDFRS